MRDLSPTGYKVFFREFTLYKSYLNPSQAITKMRKLKIAFCKKCKAFRGKEKECHKCGKKTIFIDMPIRRGGYYYIPGYTKPFGSVTKIIGETIAKPGLRYWLQREAAKIALANPYLSVGEVMAQVRGISGKAMTRGLGVHIAIEDIIKGRVKKGYPKEIKGYIKAYKKFASEVPHRVVGTEKMVRSVRYHFAGTLDCIIKLKNGDLIIVDFKTGKRVYEESALQLVAYKTALGEMYPKKKKPDSTRVLHLKEDGTYDFVEKSASLKVFLATKYLWEWMKKANNKK